MTFPSDAIATALVERLSAIATDTRFNDVEWATSVEPAAVVRLRQNARTLPDTPTIIVSTVRHRYNRNAQRTTQGLQDIRTTFQIEAYIEVMDDIDGELAKLMHDLHVVLGSDHTMAGTCRDSTIIDADILLSSTSDPVAGVVVEWEASYRTTDANPGTLI